MSKIMKKICFLSLGCKSTTFEYAGGDNQLRYASCRSSDCSSECGSKYEFSFLRSYNKTMITCEKEK